jgi:L-ascorbate metabolism protein UlaG (beta-lactamase superfamily)
MEIQWLGHASFRIISNNIVIYIDPYYGEDYDKMADIILISHDHYDHFSQEKIAKIRLDSTIILGPEPISHILRGTTQINVDEEKQINNIRIKAVPAYNLNIPNHEKGAGNGYLIAIEDKIIYFAGDTDLIPEIQDIKANIALVPIGGTYTMNAKQAAMLINKIKPDLAIPMHWGSGIVGNKDDADYFKELVETEVKLLEIGGEVEI